MKIGDLKIGDLVKVIDLVYFTPGNKHVTSLGIVLGTAPHNAIGLNVADWALVHVLGQSGCKYCMPQQLREIPQTPRAGGK
jgi:hypothetical protein